jgi:hypothetical protein
MKKGNEEPRSGELQLRFFGICGFPTSAFSCDRLVAVRWQQPAFKQYRAPPVASPSSWCDWRLPLAPLRAAYEDQVYLNNFGVTIVMAGFHYADQYPTKIKCERALPEHKFLLDVIYVLQVPIYT